jgi:hypothetical protein
VHVQLWDVTLISNCLLVYGRLLSVDVIFNAFDFGIIISMGIIILKLVSLVVLILIRCRLWTVVLILIALSIVE